MKKVTCIMDHDKIESPAYLLADDGIEAILYLPPRDRGEVGCFAFASKPSYGPGSRSYTYYTKTGYQFVNLSSKETKVWNKRVRRI